MKFLCVACDEPMTLEKAQGPEEGSLAVTFACARCGSRFALLTNPWETQLVRALGVKIGGRRVSPQPLELLRDTLVYDREPHRAPAEESAGALVWTEEARRRLDRVPEFVRPMARRAIERYAAERGHTEITSQVVDEAKERHMP